jgi:hypothetical protein
MARRVSKRYTKAFSIALSALRPDMRWIENRLGEDLPHQQGHCGSGSANRRGLKPDVIPPGGYCYYQDWLPGVKGHRPCPYFRYMPHGTVRCDYLPYETTSSDADSTRTLKFMKRRPRKETQHFKPFNFMLDDSIKLCDVHPEFSESASGFRHRLEQYRLALTGHTVEQWFGGWQFSETERKHNTYDMQLLTIAIYRLSIWECLCVLVEAVSPEDIEQLQKLDAIYQAHSDASPLLMHSGLTEDAQKHPSPEKQFWYLYRTNFKRLSPNFPL